ncbi:MAG: hypothetical protein J6N72_10680 [Psychrobacter sp.]|nr:hypothetical protein [Psychrobacter sp.]
MDNTLSLKGIIKPETVIIDPSLPKNCKNLWVGTGLLIHEALKHAYLKMTADALEGNCMPIDEAYLILAGKLPVVRQKRTEIGRNQLLAKHNTALSLFGSLSQGIEGRLKVGFIGIPNKEGECPHSMKIVRSAEKDLILLLAIINEWSNDCYLGKNTELGFGGLSAYWRVFKGDVDVGYISLKQGVMESSISFLTADDTCC